MSAPVRIVLILTVLLAASATLSLWTSREDAAQPRANVRLSDAQRDGDLRFARGTSPVDEAVVRRAIAGARPEARRLVDIIDGAVTITVGATGRTSAVGETRPGRDGFDVVLDLATVSRWLGERGVSRLVLHEMGHVVDFALVPPAMRARMDAAIPAGYPCAQAGDAACAGRAAREERFAETFAKWATGDIGVDLDIGYRVPPPSSLADWGAPLAALR